MAEATADPIGIASAGGIINWIVATLIGVLVWLVKRLTDNNQKILDAMKEENRQERLEHRSDVLAILDDSKQNRKSSEENFDKVVEALTKLTDKIGIQRNV